MEQANIGVIVRDYIKRKRVSKSALARTMGTTHKTLVGRLNFDDLRTSFVMQLSIALKHDFFADLSEAIGTVKTDNEELERLKLEILILKREKEMLKGIIAERMK